MMINSLVKKYLSFRAKKVNKKLVVFISDDWGSMRLRDAEQRNELVKKGLSMDFNRFDRFDSFETDKDFDELLNVLLKYKDQTGRHPVITAATCVANPDYKKIQDDGYSNYSYVNLPNTYAAMPQSSTVLSKMIKASEAGVFVPEFHGREHLNVGWWLKYLQDGEENFIKAFQSGCFMLSGGYSKKPQMGGVGAAYDMASKQELDAHIEIAKDGLRLFGDTFGYSAQYFAAPSLLYNSGMEEPLFREGIKLIDVARFRREPLGMGKYRKKLHYQAQPAQRNQWYITRNAVFEPDFGTGKDFISSCLNEINEAFSNRQPAVISNHRVCFMGGIEPGNREFGLKSLDQLLSAMIKRWPDLEFISVRDLLKEYINAES